MVNSNDFKTGMTIEKDNEIFSIIEFMHVKPGKGGAFVITKLRNLRTGAITDYRFNAGIKVSTARIEKIEMQYIYSDGVNCVFMNNQTYEQLEIPESKLENEKRFMPEGLTVNILMYKAKTFDEAVSKADTLVKDGGYGHTSSLYINTETEPEKLYEYEDSQHQYENLLL